LNPKGGNRSVKKTEEKLCQALTDLLKEKPAKNITVREIAERININRGTFYLHYKDIYDMIEKLENEMFEGFNTILNAHIPQSPWEYFSSILSDMYSFLADNADLCIALLGPNGDLVFLNKIKGFVRERLLYLFEQHSKSKNTDDFDYIYTFLIAGCTDLFHTWLIKGMKETPDEMAAFTKKMINNGVKELE
jgi:AcrR family transcriptional regulator